jgi:5-histidylcysteine sulfoxide synthase/putative 4-mercaptohistidine N1-methyltranferase
MTVELSPLKSDSLPPRLTEELPDYSKIYSVFPRTPNLAANNPESFREEIKRYFIETFDRYESLFECLANEEAYYINPISIRHPLIFYYGHTATFFINKLLLARLVQHRIDQRFESIFAVGVDEMSWDDLDSAHYEWPTPSDVKSYRHKVRSTVIHVIENAPLQLPVNWENAWWSIIMGIEHERIHLETSSVLIRQHKPDFVQKIPSWLPWREAGLAPENALVNVNSGTVTLDKQRNDPLYGWDNEYGTHESNVREFQASRFLVSNNEFLEFVTAKGYSRTELWEEEGQAWLNYSKAAHPTFWLKKDDGWFLRLLTEEVSMPWNWPVEVNYHEAKAFCNWKNSESGLSVRLPTEDEWYRIYDQSGLNELADSLANANIHLDYWASPCPVDKFKHGEFYDVVGNVWQWTETPIYPLNGFEVHSIYDDFSTPTFDNKHNLIKGGSWISTGNETLRNSRYAFRRHFFQHAGFRYVVSDAIETVTTSNYETDKLLSEYAEFHYGQEYLNVPNFPKKLVDIASNFLGEQFTGKALDLGCASGRATFELARYFDRVTGIDFSARFIGQGVDLINNHCLRYKLAEEGELVLYKTRTLKELGLNDFKHKVEFFQGDACNLKPQFTNYDFILAANLIDRLYSPAKFLSQIHERLNIGGVLMITSPYTWLTEHTPREEWIGAFKKDGENFTSLDGLHALLDKHFDLISPPIEVPFVIRETKRKYQHSFSEVTFWTRIR